MMLQSFIYIFTVVKRTRRSLVASHYRGPLREGKYKVNKSLTSRKKLGKLILLTKNISTS